MPVPVTPQLKSFLQRPYETLAEAAGLPAGVGTAASFILPNPQTPYGFGALAAGRVKALHPEKWASEIASTHAEYGGSSIARTGENLFGKAGYAVSVTKQTEQVLDHTPTPADIVAYMQRPDVQRALAENPNLFIGTWADGGKHFLDLSLHVPSREEAVRIGMETVPPQSAIFNLLKGESEYLTPTVGAAVSSLK